ncbi:MAG: hypothetical protein HEQ39_03805 [Rhizobacter sp.]
MPKVVGGAYTFASSGSLKIDREKNLNQIIDLGHFYKAAQFLLLQQAMRLLLAVEIGGAPLYLLPPRSLKNIVKR